MGVEKHWYLICYDIRAPKRWRKIYKKLKGRGEHLQYSIFRLHLSKVQLENLRWQMSKILKPEDDMMIIHLCPGCANRVIDSKSSEIWKKAPAKFEIL